ncbi:MAG: response regulator [Alphaproteobacteria bacterium]|nr:response regulator [Alphaproteobacteria bacterium]MBV8549162.1 response regulator [Alphaproteobacteria bacterium]
METTQQADNFFMRNATAVAIAAVTLLMLAAAIIFYRQGEANDTARYWVNHTYEVRGHIMRLLNKLEDAETGQRGYMMTGSELYLDPYKDALQDTAPNHPVNDEFDRHHSIREEIAILRRLTSDNPLQQQNIDDLEQAINKLLDYLAASISLRRNSKDHDMSQEYDPRLGKELMDNLRGIFTVLMSEEGHLLALRTQADAASSAQSASYTYMGMGIFYILLVASIWTYQRARKRAQAALLHYTQQLERSEEELKMQQEELKASNEEIEASNEELEEQNAQIRQQSEELSRNKVLIEEKAREVELASKYKSEFLANMSHELRTPLNSLLILARSLASNETGNMNEEQVNEASIIYNDGLELLNLINDILDLSKVEAGKLNIIAEETATDSIVKRLQQQFAPIAKNKNLAFPVEIGKGVPETLHTDTQRVEQILKNLLSNAFKFTERGSVTLKIHTPDSDMELQRANLGRSNTVAFSVIDTGIGIDPSKFKDIFEAFQQEDGATDRHYGGTGLGLTIARKFAHLLGGEIHVSSEKNVGSNFTLVLPIALKQSAQGETQIAPTFRQEKIVRTELKVMPRSSVAEFIPDDRKTIGDNDKVLLIIEDDKNFAAILVKIAHKRGYKCIAAGDGKTGLLMAMEAPVTAIILDLKLPDIDGTQVLDQLKHDLRTRHIPVHIITGHGNEDNVATLSKGAIGYLTKPVAEESITGVFAKIEDLLQTDIRRILVVEDDHKNQTAIQSLLKKQDITLVFADTGAKALDLLNTEALGCIILDLRLPDMTGFDWLEQAEKKAGKIGLPPIIIYTAQELTEEENRQLNRYTGSIIIKGAKSPERLLDEVTLFLHSVESTLSQEQREIIRMQHDPDKVLQSRTVLLVDDDLRNTFALSKLLKKHGMSIIIADNGQMAIDKLKENSAIDLVIMDIMMPIMDGYQAMHAIREQKRWRNLPIIALTARAMPEEQEKCMAAGANDYMTKPVDVERLLTLMRVWLFRQGKAA